jgi:FMN-dependent NADH-azoreductase
MWNDVFPFKVYRYFDGDLNFLAEMKRRSSAFGKSGRARAMKLLHIDSGILGTASVSRQLSANAVAEWRTQHPNTEVVYRDLVAQPLTHLAGDQLFAAAADPSQQSLEMRAVLAESGKVLEEFLDADVVVIGAPMYNFSIPSQLKAWIDRIAIKGKTFAYTEYGPKGLAGGKTVVIASARGGFYGATSPVAAWDHQETYLKTVFGFLGVTDVRFLRAEGVNVSPEQKEKAIHEANASVANLVASEARTKQAANAG